MNKIVLINNDNEGIAKGENLLNTNDFFKELTEIMEDKKFSNFFEKWFTTLGEIKVTVIYMKLYNELKKKWKMLTDEELDKKINIFIIWNMMREKNMNKFTISTIMDSLENKNIDIFQELKNFIQINDKT